MNQEATEIYDYLWKSIADVSSRWIISKQLFSSKEVVMMLNQSAPCAFGVFFWSLYDSIILGISRLTDAPKKSGRNYFTLQNFTAHVGSPISERIKEEIDKHLQDFKPIRDRRDQQKAHSDKIAPTITVATRKEIDAAINGLISIMSVIETELGLGHVGYEYTLMLGDGDTLVNTLTRNAVRRRRNLLGRAYFYHPNECNVDEELYQLTALKRDPQKTIVFPNAVVRDDVLDAVYELFGAIAENSGHPNPFLHPSSS